LAKTLFLKNDIRAPCPCQQQKRNRCSNFLKIIFSRKQVTLSDCPRTGLNVKTVAKVLSFKKKMSNTISFKGTGITIYASPPSLYPTHFF